MPRYSRRCLVLMAGAAALAACSGGRETGERRLSTSNAGPQAPPLHPNETPALRRLINRYADHYDVPRGLVHRLAIRESAHRPGARNGPYHGLLQIHPQTARSMGFRGPPGDLLNAETNLEYAVKYLRGAYIVAGGDPDAAIMWYARGYYHEAKCKGLLVKTGLRAD